MPPVFQSFRGRLGIVILPTGFEIEAPDCIEEVRAPSASSAALERCIIGGPGTLPGPQRTATSDPFRGSWICTSRALTERRENPLRDPHV